jgi:hypothetical protein
MAAIVWLPLDEDHPYHATHAGWEEKPHDGFELHSQWIGEDANEKSATGIRRRKYWLQVLTRGLNDGKALLTVYGIPVPPEVTQEHVDDAKKYLGWEKVTWEIKHRGVAWIFRDSPAT